MYVLKRRKPNIKRGSKGNLKSKGKNTNSSNTNELLKKSMAYNNQHSISI